MEPDGGDKHKKGGEGLELMANGTLRSDESFSHEKTPARSVADHDDDMWIHGGEDLLDFSRSKRRTMFGRMHWWWLVLGMVLLGLVVSLVIIFTKDQPPYQKAIYKQSVAEELRSDTAASITAVNETFVRAWSPDTLCSFNGTSLPLGIAKPLLYNLTLYLENDHFAPDEGNAQLSFDAEVGITFAVNQSTNCLVMHSAGLNYNKIWVSNAEGKTGCACGNDRGCPTSDCWKVVKRTGETESSDLVIFDLSDTPLPGGTNITLHASYNAHFSPNLGLYRSAPFTYYGQYSSVLVVTQLEQAGARHVFPSYDQPAHKAEFEVTVQYPSNMVALSNTPAVAAFPGSKDGLLLQRFARTPVMSPYLLAVCVGILKNRTMTSEGFLYQVVGWATPDLEWQLDTGMQAAVRALDFYTQWTGVQQPLKVFNLVAVPGKKGSMENWGLIMFDEDRFLLHTGTEGAYGEWLCADVVCHEIAHQWFGNLVTCANWAEITINEGIATFMEYKCLEAASPKMSGSSFFQIATSPMDEWIGVHEGPRSLALQADDDPDRAALVPQLNSSGSAVLQYTGRIAYSKGASVLAMLEAYWEALLQDSFQNGMQSFLRRHIYGVATTADLLQSLLDALLAGPPNDDPRSDLNRRGIMLRNREQAAAVLAPWFKQPGYPLITVRDQRDDAMAPQYTFSQDRFLRMGGGENEPPETPWFVPLPIGNMGYFNLSYELTGNEEDRWSFDDEAWFSLDGPNAYLPAAGPQGAPSLNYSWVANKDGLGFYRTLYLGTHLKALVARLKGLRSPPEHEGGLAAATVLQVSNSAVGPLREASALLEDTWALSYAGKLDTPSILALYLAASESQAASGGMGKYLLLLPVLNGIRRIASLVYNSYPCRADLDSYVVSLLSNHTDQLITMVARSGKVGSVSDHRSQSNFLGRIIRPKVVVAASLHGDELAPNILCNLFKQHYNKDLSLNTLDADLRGAAYIVAVARPDGCELDEEPEEAWDLMLEKWNNQPDVTESRRGLFALAYSRNEDRIKKTLNVALDPNNEGTRAVDFTDRLAMLSILGHNRWARDMIWPYVRDNWDALAKKYGNGVWRLLEEVAQPLSQDQVDVLQKFFSEGPGKDGPEETRARILGQLQHDLTWLQANQQELCDFIQLRQRRRRRLLSDVLAHTPPLP